MVLFELHKGVSPMSGANSSNSTLNGTCKLTNDLFLQEEGPQWLLTIHIIVASTIIIASLIGSGLVLLLVAKFKELRTRTVKASLSVVVVDLLLDLNYHLPAVISTIARRWLFSEAGCVAIGFMGYEFFTTRWFIMAVLCTDRFCTVRFPFSYEKYSKCVLVVLTITAWVLPFVLTIPGVIPDFGNFGFRPNIPTCAVDCQNNRCRGYFRVLTTTSFVIGGIIPIVLYLWMYCRARKLRPTALVLGRLSVQVASGAVISQPVAQVEQHSRELRAVVTFALIFVTVLVTEIPAYIFLILRTINIAVWCRIPLVIHFIGIEIFFLATALDPMLILRDRDFRRCLSKLCCCGCTSRTDTRTYSNSSTCNNVTDVDATSHDTVLRSVASDTDAEVSHNRLYLR